MSWWLCFGWHVVVSAFDSIILTFVTCEDATQYSITKPHKASRRRNYECYNWIITLRLGLNQIYDGNSRDNFENISQDFFFSKLVSQSSSFHLPLSSFFFHLVKSIHCWILTGKWFIITVTVLIAIIFDSLRNDFQLNVFRQFSASISVERWLKLNFNSSSIVWLWHVLISWLLVWFDIKNRAEILKLSMKLFGKALCNFMSKHLKLSRGFSLKILKKRMTRYTNGFGAVTDSWNHILTLCATAKLFNAIFKTPMKRSKIWKRLVFHTAFGFPPQINGEETQRKRLKTRTPPLQD